MSEFSVRGELMWRIWTLGIAIVSAIACDGGSFSGGGGKTTAPKPAPQPAVDPGKDGGGKSGESDGDDGAKSGGGKSGGELGQEADPGEETPPGPEVDQGEAEPEGLIELQGENLAPPDLNSCASLPAQGKVGYGPNAKCQANAVVVVINDGKAQEMTCCPMKGKNILSSKAEELYVARVGSCNGDEVVTGMTSAAGPGLFCSRLNPKLKLGARSTAIYAAGQGLSPVMNQIASSYNVGDTCICPEGTVYVGQHTTDDNTCVDQCAKVVKK